MNESGLGKTCVGTLSRTHLGAFSQIFSLMVTILGIVFISWQISDSRRFNKSQLLNDLQKESKDYRPMV